MARPKQADQIQALRMEVKAHRAALATLERRIIGIERGILLQAQRETQSLDTARFREVLSVMAEEASQK